MKKTLALCFLTLAFISCSESPETAAQEVCNCYMSLGEAELKSVMGATQKCLDLAKEYKAEFNQEELKFFRKATTDCITDGLLKN
jgi:hypothetical protein